MYVKIGKNSKLKLFILKWLIVENVDVFTDQLTELHYEEEGDALAALAQTLKNVGVFKTPAGRQTKTESRQ